MTKKTKKSDGGGLLDSADKSFFKVEDTLNLIGGMVILGALFLGVLHVALRFFFNSHVEGYVDIMEQLMIVFSFFGLAYCQRTNGHIRMDLIVNKLKGRTLWSVELITTVLATIVIAALTIGAYKHFERSFLRGDSTPDIEIALWYAKFAAFAGLAVLLVRFILQTFSYGRLVLKPHSKPIGTPEKLFDEINDGQSSQNIK